MGNKNLINRLGFLDKELDRIVLSFPDNDSLSNKMDAVFYFDKGRSEQLRTRFYWINASKTSLDEIDIRAIHKRIWNENKSDLLFIEKNNEVEVNYVSTSPLDNLLTITKISTNVEDSELLDKISKEHITTGAFWIEYNNALERIEKSKKTVDQALIGSLKYLREQLDNIYESCFKDESERRRIVQALIDRTLFIKFLEDKQIINAVFYEKYFGDKELNYKELLIQKKSGLVNELFAHINEVFNNKLFDTPRIADDDLSEDVLTAIANTIAATQSNGQLSLFDFQFDIMPIEFISRIYQIFLDDKKKEGGIFYTPEGLASLVLDNVLKGEGTLLDPSCGSGMFLILAFRKMYVSPTGKLTTRQKIQHRLEFIKKHIFGIEIESTAARLALFSLYLEVLNSQEITSNDINTLITENINTEHNTPIFTLDFSDNIQESNALLEGELCAFKDLNFDYIVGNPPWFMIEQKENDINYAYWNNYNNIFTRERQISQCFLHCIKQWSNKDTRYGFIVNSSNFINESDKFQRFFYSTYGIESIFELYHVKDILFDYACEPACVIIFNNQKCDSNKIRYFLPRLNKFVKTFRTILLNQSDIINIAQSDLIEQKIKLRNYLIGSSSELELANQIEQDCIQFSEIMLEDFQDESCRGFEDWGEDALKREYNVDKTAVPRVVKEEYKQLLLSRYYSSTKDQEHCVPFVKSAQLSRFSLFVNTFCLDNIANFHRPRSPFIYLGDKILCTRIGGKFNAIYSKDKIYFGTDIFVVKLQNPELYHVITCCLNSDLIDYYSQIKLRKRIDGALTRLNSTDLKKLPIPKKLDPIIMGKLIDLSKNIHSGTYSFDEKKEELNELVFDLYSIDYISKQRIRDFYIANTTFITKTTFEEYCSVFYKTIKRFLKTGIAYMEYSYNPNMPFDITGVKIVFGISEDSTKKLNINKVQLSINHQLLKQVGDSALILLKERIYSTDSIFIIKDTNPKNWTKSAAYDDAKAEIEKLLRK